MILFWEETDNLRPKEDKETLGSVRTRDRQAVHSQNDKHLHRGQNIMPLTFEIYASASDSVNKLIRSKAAEITFTPNHILLSHWRKRFSVCLQHRNALIIINQVS